MAASDTEHADRARAPTRRDARVPRSASRARSRGVEMNGEEKAPGAAMIIGKVLNAFLLDHVQTDLEFLTRMNQVIDDGRDRVRPRFFAARERRGRAPRRARVPPRRDARRSPERRHRPPRRRLRAQTPAEGQRRHRPPRLLTLIDVGEATEADLAEGYLLFDGPFTKKLIELGRADAEARKREIADFFGGASEDGAPRSSDSGEWIVPPPVE